MRFNTIIRPCVGSMHTLIDVEAFGRNFYLRRFVGVPPANGLRCQPGHFAFYFLSFVVSSHKIGE